MKKNSLIVIIVIVAAVCIVAFNGCSTYNNFVDLDQNVEKSWAQVETQYQRRFDLIPNLVETVKGYAAHESETYIQVTQARAGLTDAYNNAKGLENADMTNEESFQKYTDAQASLNRAFNIYVNAVREAYPDLKANEQFRDLQVQLEGTENRIATARTDYVDQVRIYNSKVKRFPSNLWASMFGFDAKPQFKADAEAQSAPKVQF